MMEKKIPKSVVERIPLYLTYLKKIESQNVKLVSSKSIAKELGLGEIQVRKDLNLISANGKPKIGHQTLELIHDIENLIFKHNCINVIIIGAGKIGEALVKYQGFETNGFKVLAIFDNDVKKIGKKIGDLTVSKIDDLKKWCETYLIDIGIITVPSDNAQEICEKLLECKIKGILNFTNQKLNTKKLAYVLNVDITSFLTMLAIEINNNLKGE